MFNLDLSFLRIAAPILLVFTIATLMLLWYTKKLENRMTCWTAGLVCYAAGFMLAIPLILLFELSLIAIWFTERRRAREAASEAP